MRIELPQILISVCLAFTVCSRADVVTQPLRKFGLGDLQVAAISPDGKWMATCGSGGAFIWDYQTGTLVHRLEAHHREVLVLCFSPSGVLLSGGGDAVIRAWDVESGAVLRSFEGSIGRILDLSFAPDGESFVSVADDKARVWSVSNGELLHTFATPGAGIARAMFAPDGRRLVTAHVSFTDTPTNIRLWDLATEQTIRSFSDSFVQSLAFLANGNLVTGGADLAVQVWDIETGQLVRALPGTTQAELAFQGFLTSTNSSVLVGGCLNGRVITWDASTGQILNDFTGESLFSLAAIPGTNQILTAHPDNLVRVKDGQLGTTLRTVAGHTAGANVGVGFSPDRQYVVSGGNEALTRLWNRTNGEQVRAFPGFAGGTAVASFSPSGTQIRAFSNPGSLISARAISPDGMTLASGASDGVVRLWNTSDGQLRRSFQFNAGAVSSLQFSPATGDLLAAWEDGILQTFDPATGTVRLSSLTPAGFVGAAAFSPDGRFIVDAEGFPSFSARLWEARTGEELRVFAGHAAEVYSVAFDSTGTLILTGSDIVRLWSMADIAARLESERKPDGLELRWHFGTLQRSTNVNGPWFDISEAVSP